jgi:hypothetical protein
VLVTVNAGPLAIAKIFLGNSADYPAQHVARYTHPPPSDHVMHFTSMDIPPLLDLDLGRGLGLHFTIVDVA